MGYNHADHMLAADPTTEDEIYNVIFGTLIVIMGLAMCICVVLFDCLDMFVSFFEGGHLHVRR